MIKVIHVVDNIIQATLGGGMMRHVKYAAELRDLGIASEWVTMETDVDAAFEETWRIRVRQLAIDETLPLHARRKLLLHYGIQEASKIQSQRCVVATITCRAALNTAAQIWKARMQGIPSVYNSSIKPGPLPTRLLSVIREKFINRAFLQANSLVVPQTAHIERFFREYLHLPSSKMEIIGNGVECDHYRPSDPMRKQHARLLLGLPEHAKIVVSVGNVVPRKGTHLLLQAWHDVLRNHPDAILVIVGTLGHRTTFGDLEPELDAYGEEVQRLISQLPSPRSVVLSGKHETNTLDYYQAADAFTFTSEREGLPNSVLEAMACGLPSVLVPYDGFPADGEEMGSDGTHFLKCDRNAESVAQGLSRVLADVELSSELGQTARSHMLATQDLPEILRRWAAVYHRLAESS